MLLYYWIYQTLCKKQQLYNARQASHFSCFLSTRLINSTKHGYTCKIFCRKIVIYLWTFQIADTRPPRPDAIVLNSICFSTGDAGSCWSVSSLLFTSNMKSLRNKPRLIGWKYIEDIRVGTQENLSSGFPTKRVSNQFPQLQGLARNLKSFS